MTTSSATKATLATIFGRLFENEFATLDDIAISCRTDEGMDYVDGIAGLCLWLEDEVTRIPPEPADPAAVVVHAALHAACPEYDTVISGISRHLRALLLEGLGPPPATSMMRNRGVPDLAVHLVEPEALAEGELAETIARAHALSGQNGMRHLLMVTTEGLVVAAGAPAFETMAHWHNVEFAARVECMRIEEVETQVREGPR